MRCCSDASSRDQGVKSSSFDAEAACAVGLSGVSFFSTSFAQAVKFLNSSAKFTASREAVGMNAKRTREMKTSDCEAIHYTEEQVEQELKDFGGSAPEMSTLPLEYPFRQCYQFRAQPDGKLYYRRYACACDPCMDSPNNGWDTSQCEYKAVYEDLNQWRCIEPEKFVKKGRAKVGTRTEVQEQRMFMVQESTDDFAESLEDGLTYAVHAVDDDGDATFWLLKLAGSDVVVVDEEFEDSVMKMANGSPWIHRVGDHVIEGYYYDDAEGRPGCYTLLDSNKVSVPTHMLIIVDGFEMELATAQAKGGKSKASRKRSDAQVFKLSSSVREAIVRALPEPWTEESL